MSDPIVRVAGLEKSYAATTVLAGVDLEVSPGSACWGPTARGRPRS
nr:hypothetical protein [Rhodococcus rhodnii]